MRPRLGPTNVVPDLPADHRPLQAVQAITAQRFRLGSKQRFSVSIVGAWVGTAEAAMRIDQEFLLYPLGTEEQPDCPACGKPMTIALHEARKGDPDFATYRCQACTRSERFVVEN